MTEPWDFVPALAAEFPNDNPALHQGVSWLCLTFASPAKPVARPRPHAPAPRRAPAEPPAIVLEIGPVSAPRSGPSVDVPVGVASDAVIQPLSEPVAPLAASAEEDVANAFDVFALAPLEPDVEWAIAELLSSGGLREAPVVDASPAAPVEAPVEPIEPLPPLSLELTPSPSPADGDPGVIELDTVDTDPAEADAGFTIAPESALLEESGDAPACESAARDGAPAAEAPAPVALGAEAATPEREKDAFDAFVGALVDVALSAGATRAAAQLPLVLDDAGDLSALGDEQRTSLARAGVLAGDGAARGEAFRATALAWRRVLRGETNDFGACGSTTLDAWGVELLRAFGVGQDGRVDVRRELRKRGVAAFGMRAAA